MERLLRVAFWCCLWGFALYGLYALGRHHVALVSLGVIVLLVGGVAVAERPRSD